MIAMIVKSFTFVILVLGYVIDSEGLSRPSTMTLENNEYKNVVIAIHESIPEDKTLIDTLKVSLFITRALREHENAYLFILSA
jgi:hypothetical protein